MDIAKRFAGNPILRPGDLKPSKDGLKIECLLNPGVFRYDGKIWMLLRVAERPEQKDGLTSFPVYSEDGELQIMEFKNDDPDLDLSDPRVISYQGQDYLTTISHLRLVCSEDGIHFHEPEGYPLLTGKGIHESYGIEDCRVSQVGDTYHLTYTAVSHLGVGVGLRTTKNWKDFEHHGMIFPAHNKDCAIFEEKVNERFYAFHRPSSPEIGGNYIWLASSPDGDHWGNHQCIAQTRKGKWDNVRIGAGAAPIRTDEGWLEIYHGANEDNQYCLGALLLDINDPSNVLARSEEPIMVPTEEYEKTGFFGNVIFTNGHLVDGDEITMYYGAADEVICGAKFSIREILETLH